MEKKFIILLVMLLMSGCGIKTEKDIRNDFKYEYGVFLNVDSSEVSQMKDYRKIVIDASYFTKEDIEEMHGYGQEVYTYINVGSLEEFRDYYEQYSHLCLGEYENWAEEKWIDVSQEAWQEHVITYARELTNKGVDGFFIDNCDVYYQYQKPEIFDGLTNILRSLHNITPEIIINGGDTYVTEYMERYGTATDIMSGVNQECVFSAIDFDNGSFTQNAKEEFDYFTNYVERCATDHLDVYLLEYTMDKELIENILQYCEKNHFFCYISSSIELKVPSIYATSYNDITVHR